jgi:hypothetical protein
MGGRVLGMPWLLKNPARRGVSNILVCKRHANREEILDQGKGIR